MSVLVVGAATVDQVYHLEGYDKIPIADSIQADDHFLRPGGKGLNMAVAAKRLGALTYLITAIGSDRGSIGVLQTLKKEGISLELVEKMNDRRTPRVSVLRLKNRKTTYVGWSGKHAAVIEADHVRTARAREVVGEVDIVLGTLEAGNSALTALAERCHETGKPLLLRLSPRPQAGAHIAPVDARGLAKEAAFLVGTAREFCHTLEIDEGDHDALEGSIGANFPKQHCIITRGASGARIVSPDGRFTCEIKQHEPRDCCGAGDAFAAQLAVALSKDPTDLRHASLLACAAGLASVSNPGGFESFAKQARVREKCDQVTIIDDTAAHA